MDLIVTQNKEDLKDVNSKIINLYIDLCPVCLRKLQSNMQFDVRKRFKDMQKICEEFKFVEMAEYYKKASES